MYIDYLTTAALAQSMREQLLGARVQDVLQPDRNSLSLEMYAGARRYLTVSADPQHEGMLLSSSRSRRGEGAITPLMLAARKHLEGARLQEIDQPPYERILRLSFEGAQRVDLVVELMGRLANVILVEADDAVIACAHAVTGQMTRARTVVPRRPYEPPPPPPKTAPHVLSDADVVAWLAEDASAPAWRVLVRNLLGVSPLVGKEAAHRACGNAGVLAGDVEASTLTAALRGLTDLADNGAWSPCIVLDGDDIVAYAPYELTHRVGQTQTGSERIEAVPDIESCIERFTAARIGRDPYRDARAAVEISIGEARSVAERQVAALKRERIDEADVQLLRTSGDLILAYQTLIKPGDVSFTPPPETGATAAIVLDPLLSAVENAQAYYRRYQRKRDAAAKAPARIAAAEARLATLEQLATDLALAENRNTIDGVRYALAEGGFVTPKRTAGRAPDAGRPIQLQSSDGFTLLVGRNSRQNERVTFDRAKRGDLWLHARDVPGSHVVIKTAGQHVPERTVHEAAALAAWFSRLRSETRVVVAVTDVKHVKRMRGAGVGMVTFKRDHSVVVSPTSPEDLKLV